MLAKIVLWVMIVGSAVGGLAYLLAPSQMLEAAGLSGNASGLTDARAVYGGLQLGLAAYLFWAVRSEDRIAHAVLLVAVTVSAVALCRVAGLIVDGDPTGFHMISLTFEVAAGVAAFLGYRRETAPPAPIPA